MEKLIDWVNSFDRRVIKPIYDIQGDLDFACLDKTAIAEDLGFETEDHGGSRDVIPVRFESIEDVEAFPWKKPDQAVDALQLGRFFIKLLRSLRELSVFLFFCHTIFSLFMLSL